MSSLIIAIVVIAVVYQSTLFRMTIGMTMIIMTLTPLRSRFQDSHPLHPRRGDAQHKLVELRMVMIVIVIVIVIVMVMVREKNDSPPGRMNRGCS